MPLSINIAYSTNVLECYFSYPPNALVNLHKMEQLADSSKVVMVTNTDHFLLIALQTLYTLYAT